VGDELREQYVALMSQPVDNAETAETLSRLIAYPFRFGLFYEYSDDLEEQTKYAEQLDRRWRQTWPSTPPQIMAPPPPVQAHPAPLPFPEPAPPPPAPPGSSPVVAAQPPLPVESPLPSGPMPGAMPVGVPPIGLPTPPQPPLPYGG
jgi:hypothetical protein